MFKSFIKSEKAQGALEYILLAGGIIVASIIMFVLYKQAGENMGWFINSTKEEVAAKESERISTEMAKF